LSGNEASFWNATSHTIRTSLVTAGYGQMQTIATIKLATNGGKST